jgi:hypothetical protein
MNQWVLIIILIVVLILFGRPFLDIGRGISESLYNSFLLLSRSPQVFSQMSEPIAL